ncbi:esterase/lipase family protein [Marinobacter sp. F4216]|uniref:esterase/lipase family protein n=1 Tax=Marinobacter sp. F4216 TaxID=2874281 RepID=UPI001CBAA6C3|nr:GPI inositol-deacylase [Marinobacter sp. F4216]MBZ2169355.1 GPI inositol-deacylase [Marinobacter sp. F4216]
MPLGSLSHWQRQTSAIASGFFGDRLESRRNPLAVSMCLIESGRELDVDNPQPENVTETLCVSIHGLMELETVWRISGSKAGAGFSTYGQRLAAALPGSATDLSLRYNTGLPVYRNGQALSVLLKKLISAWPKPVKRLILIGHSMGGLLIRSACHYGRIDGHRWTRVLSDCVYLGSPHDGSWLARGAHSLANLMGELPRDYLQVVGEMIDLRSEGIRNLSRGEVLAEQGEHPPLLPGVNHYVVCGLLARSRQHPANALFGDALVQLSSAQGRKRSGWQLAGVATFPGVDHLRLAHHPSVAEQLEAWLV